MQSVISIIIDVNAVLKLYTQHSHSILNTAFTSDFVTTAALLCQSVIVNKQADVNWQLQLHNTNRLLFGASTKYSISGFIGESNIW